MYSDKITFVIFTYNEEARVERAVRNFVPYGRIMVVDNFSTDRTVELATALGAEVLQHKNSGWVEDEETTSKVKAAIKTPWLYWSFADEIVDRQTMKRMLEVIESDKYSIVNVARKNYYYGEFCEGAYRNAQTRAFKKDAVDFRNNTIHLFGKITVPESEVAYLDREKYFVHHFISNTAKTYTASLDRYTDIEALHAKVLSPINMLIHIARGFVGNYFLRGGRKAGRAGFYLSMQISIYQLLLSMKAYERQHQLNTATIEQKNNEIRNQLLVDLESSEPLSH